MIGHATARGEDQDLDKEPYQMATVVVTAAKVDGYPSETGSSVTVITADELKKSGSKL